MNSAQEFIKTGARANPFHARSFAERGILPATGSFVADLARDEWPAELMRWRDDTQSLMQNLRFAMKDQTPCVIGFTGAQNGEGVSTLAAAVSLLLARDQQAAHAKSNGASLAVQTLLLDANVRRPALHQFFGVSLAHGLVEILRAEMSPAQALKEVSASNIKLLTAGEANTAGLQYGQIEKLGVLLGELKTQFECIFIDLPPVLGNVDTAELSTLCDGLVFIVKAHRTKREIVGAALRELEKCNTRVLGCVFNQRRFFIPNWLNQRL